MLPRRPLESTSFSPLKRLFDQDGLLPTLIECTTSPSLLQDIAHQLHAPDRPLPAEFLDTLFQRHQGNIRNCLGDLYDLCARDDRI